MICIIIIKSYLYSVYSSSLKRTIFSLSIVKQLVKCIEMFILSRDTLIQKSLHQSGHTRDLLNWERIFFVVWSAVACRVPEVDSPETPYYYWWFLGDNFNNLVNLNCAVWCQIISNPTFKKSHSTYSITWPSQDTFY